VDLATGGEVEAHDEAVAHLSPLTVLPTDRRPTRGQAAVDAGTTCGIAGPPRKTNRLRKRVNNPPLKRKE
jgi:hypothetical protein